jgi:hypothetical protein
VVSASMFLIMLSSAYLKAALIKLRLIRLLIRFVSSSIKASAEVTINQY